MVNVTKATGEREPFSEDKLRSSIKRARIPEELQNQLVSHIRENLYENIPTSQIYKYISDFFQKNNPYNNSRYSLKQAIMDLGPTGYPFEDFVAEILKAKGYKTTLRKVLNGKCINHEIDVIAEKDNEKIMLEAKFHNETGIKTDVHVALYTQARFEDIKETHGFTSAHIATNTKMTDDAVSFANCSGIKILSWNRPEGKGLRELIEQLKLFPITQLSLLSIAQKQTLLQNHTVLCKNLKKEDLLVLNLPENKISQILSEASYVSSQL